ncbi:MAG: tyrosine-type recombinase/integrase [Sedimentisphaerales bacterium]|nr:tyrosine-type recombinase/integrase [Sedimentisphaerales bacterium]
MAIEKVGIYRKYHGKVPKDKKGKPLPKELWPKKRPFSWSVRWFSTDGKRYSKSFKTRKEAENYAETRQLDVRSGKPDLPKKVTLQYFYDEHKELMEKNLSKSTLRLHLEVISNLAKRVGWNCDLKRVKPTDIERVRASRLKSGIAQATANKEFRAIKRVFNLAISRGYLSDGSNPCQSIKQIKIAPKRPNYCSPEEFSSIYHHATDTFWKAILATVYTTGLRLQELLNLTWFDIDFQDSQLHVTRKSEGQWVQPWQPKDCETRVIPLPEQTINLLTAWQSVAPEECPYVFMEHERWNFYKRKVKAGTWNKGQSLSNNVLRRFKTLCKRAKVKVYSIHDLRRSCITNWAKSLPVHVVQMLAGHSDIHTTQMYYLSVQGEDIKNAQMLQSKMLGKIPETDLTDPKVTHFGKIRVFPGKDTGCRKP